MPLGSWIMIPNGSPLAAPNWHNWSNRKVKIWSFQLNTDFIPWKEATGIGSVLRVPHRRFARFWRFVKVPVKATQLTSARAGGDDTPQEESGQNRQQSPGPPVLPARNPARSCWRCYEQE
jgi:hypothetical protein